MTFNTVRPKYDACLAHFTDAARLWQLRTHASHLSHYTVVDLQAMEQKLASHVSELLVLPETSWEVCENEASSTVGGVFLVSVLAFRSYDQDKIKQAVDLALVSHELISELVSALGWMPSEMTEPWIDKLLSSKDLPHKFIAIAVCSVRRYDPGERLTSILEREDCHRDPFLYSRCLRLVGELKRQDLKGPLMCAGDHEDEHVRFWAIWSLMLLGEHYRADALKPFVLTVNANRRRALDMAFKVLPGAAAREWIADLSQGLGRDRDVVVAMASLGDPKGVNWLLTKMRDVELARLAAEAFYHITGISITEQNLAMDVPDLQGMVPDDGPDKSGDLPKEDDNLPWPDADKVSAVWLKYGDGFRAGQRYFLGERITRDALLRQIDTSIHRYIDTAPASGRCA